MKTKRVAHHGLWVLGLAGLLAGCSSVSLDDKSKVPVENRTATAVQPGANTGSRSETQVASVDLNKGGSASTQAAIANLPHVVYFDFDSFVVKDEFRPVIEGNARVLTSTRTKKMTVEGHTDERGGREYNLALGQKRAEAVAKSLVLLGAGENQLEAVSFGKERPVALGSDEESWAKNRRAELVNR
ncbi:MAG TPA: peptidoglycan-associated lipoprotein Pal [Albitalea sp.]|nr:peptidoglycan-associated lipoprotein Pal [Albitalea sp.]